MDTNAYQGYLTIKVRFDKTKTKVRQINWMVNEIRKHRIENPDGVCYVSEIDRQAPRIFLLRIETTSHKGSVPAQFEKIQEFKQWLMDLEVKGNESIRIYEILDGSC